MTGLSTLLWLEVRKHAGWIGFMWLSVLGCYLLSAQIYRWAGGGLQAGIGIVSLATAWTLGISLVFIAQQGGDFAREHRAGRLPLLLGAPLPAWQFVLIKVLLGVVALGVFGWGMWLTTAPLLSKTGVILPLGIWAKSWLWLLGGAPFLLLALCVGLASAAYIPRRAAALALFMALLGLMQLTQWIGRGVQGWLYTLPPWSLPAPRVALNPLIEREFNGFPGLPVEVFLVLLALSAVCFWLITRMWNEVEA